MNDPQTLFRSAFIAFVGRPNSGKSSLMNTILGEQISIVTSLPQTTRRNIKGIYSSETMQLVFVDTPGIHKGKHALNESMLKEASEAFSQDGIDLICYIVDLSRDFGDEEATVAGMIKKSKNKVLLIFNKTDMCENPDVKIGHFHELFPEFKAFPSIKISALEKESKDVFLNAVSPFIPEGPRYYDPESLTDENLRFFAAEYIRKQIILNTREEVPHATFVEIESYKETDERHTVDATIHVETIGQRGIIVGKKGVVIGKIRKAAEDELSLLVQVPVTITCHVKVSPKWRDNESFLHRIGVK